ncbi:hypothetical protein SAMN04515660_2097 [Luteibacter sp. 329MFSha]|nr:hypothetical protein SAMN04515660_2097 [Luteibacter sp. 329MFSha]
MQSHPFVIARHDDDVQPGLAIAFIQEHLSVSLFRCELERDFRLG